MKRFLTLKLLKINVIKSLSKSVIKYRKMEGCQAYQRQKNKLFITFRKNYKYLIINEIMMVFNKTIVTV